MKKAILLFLGLTAAIGAFPQTQQGYVKTQGLPDNPGKPLAGVTIRWYGTTNVVVSKADGTFSTSFPGKKNGEEISLLSVQKNGYELTDNDMIGRPLVFSTSVPIEIVLVSSDVLEARRNHISEMAYKKAEERYQSRLAQLEKQLKDEEVTLAQYQQESHQLQLQYEKYTAMIEGMAERYARTDYDHLDSIEAQINICIENGDFDKADSLIHTVFNPSTVLERNRKAKAKVQAKMQLAQELIDRANADIEALRRDSNYAKRVMLLCDNLAVEYLAQGNTEKYNECLRNSLAIRVLLYGEDSEEVRMVKQKTTTVSK